MVVHFLFVLYLNLEAFHCETYTVGNEVVRKYFDTFPVSGLYTRFCQLNIKQNFPSSLTF